MRFSEDEFSAALVEALRNFHDDSLKVEQIECLRRVIFLCEDVLAVMKQLLPVNSLLFGYRDKGIACSRLSVSGDDQKSGRGTSGVL